MAVDVIDSDVVESGKRPRRTQETRSSLSTKLLLQATADLIAERGYERTTLIEIGRRAGYSHGLVTRRFGSKANLVRSLIVKLSQRFGHGQMSQTIGDNTGVDALVAVLVAIRSNATASRDSLRGFYALLFEALKPTVELQDFMAELHVDFIEDVTTKVAEGHSTGRLAADIAPRELTEFTLSTLRGLAYRWMLDEERVDMEAGLNTLISYVKILADPDSDGPR